MRVFSHGQNVNFQKSTKEMFAADLNKIILRFMESTESLLFGSIDVANEALYLFGRLQKIEIDESADLFSVSFQQMEDGVVDHLERSFADLEISHEAIFDVIDEKKGRVQSRVIYVTFWDEEKKDEVTYFFIDEHQVSNPLECVVSFWEQVSDVGRDVDFNLTGCAAHDRKRKCKNHHHG
jgi:hypothetical protein